METRRMPWLKRLPALFEIPAPDAERARHRILTMERTVMLPVKVFFALMIYRSFNYSPWVGEISSALDVTVETVQLIFGFYVLFSFLIAVPLFAVNHVPLAVVQWTPDAAASVD